MLATTVRLRAAAITAAMNQQNTTQMDCPSSRAASPRRKMRSATPVATIAAKATYLVDTGNPRLEAVAITEAETAMITQARSMSQWAVLPVGVTAGSGAGAPVCC